MNHIASVLVVFCYVSSRTLIWCQYCNTVLDHCPILIFRFNTCWGWPEVTSYRRTRFACFGRYSFPFRHVGEMILVNSMGNTLFVILTVFCLEINNSKFKNMTRKYLAKLFIPLVPKILRRKQTGRVAENLGKLAAKATVQRIRKGASM